MIEWAVTSSVLILVVLILRQCLKGRLSAGLQYGLWALVLVRLLVPVSFGSTQVSVLNAVEGVQTHMSAPALEGAGGQIPGNDTVPGDPSPAGEAQHAQTPQRPVVPEGAGQENDSPAPVGMVLLAVWGAGAAGVGLWLLWVNVRFARALGRSRRPLQVEECPRPVYVTGAVQTPCLFGLVRPAIYLTPQAAEDETVLRHSLEHELTHFRHGDHVWAALWGLCLALHWYNPLVWAAASLSRRDGELCCDEATVKRLGEGERAAYGRTLLAVTCQGRARLLLTATSMTGSGRGIKERILLLTKHPRTAAYALVVVLLAAVGAVGCTFTGAQKTGGETEIALADGIDVPQAVADYAREYVQEEWTYYEEQEGYDITGAEIVGLTQISNGAAAENWGISMYCLEYRLKAADPDQVVLAGGMDMVDGAITEWGSAGQPYLLLHWEDTGNETRWEPVCVTHTDTIVQDYGTPEMLEEYSNAYTAASMELYFRFRGEKAMDETFYQMLSGWYDTRYPEERWYFQTDQPEQPMEGDICLGPVHYKGGAYLNETTGEVYVVEVSCYENGQFLLQPDPHTLVLQRGGQDGEFQEVLGALERDTGAMTVEDIVLNVAFGLMDADVSLRRDGYPLPIGPGAWVDLFRPAYDGEPEVQVLAGYEPIYDEGDYWEQWSVEGFSACRYYSAGENRWSANTIDVTRGDLYTPRGIRVGDSRAEVLQAYPEALTGDYWGKYPEEPDLLAYVAWSFHVPGEISDLSQLGFYQGLGPAILFFFEGDTLRQITLTNMFN